MKGVISADHIPVSEYQLLFLGLPPLTITEISGIEEELQTTELPDKTTATTGDSMPTEYSIKIPLHETVQIAALELWFQLCKAGDPLSKKVGTLLLQSISGNILRSYSVLGTYPFKRGLPDLSMENEGELAVMEWTFKADEILWLG